MAPRHGAGLLSNGGGQVAACRSQGDVPALVQAAPALPSLRGCASAGGRSVRGAGLPTAAAGGLVRRLAGLAGLVEQSSKCVTTGSGFTLDLLEQVGRCSGEVSVGCLVRHVGAQGIADLVGDGGVAELGDDAQLRVQLRVQADGQGLDLPLLCGLVLVGHGHHLLGGCDRQPHGGVWVPAADHRRGFVSRGCRPDASSGLAGELGVEFDTEPPSVEPLGDDCDGACPYKRVEHQSGLPGLVVAATRLP